MLGRTETFCSKEHLQTDMEEQLTEQQYRLRIAEVPINDSSDYDYLWESAIHNSLAPLWKFAETSKGTMHFNKTINTSKDAYGGMVLELDAIFNDRSDMAYFKLNFDLPWNAMEVTSGMEVYFKKD